MGVPPGIPGNPGAQVKTDNAEIIPGSIGNSAAGQSTRAYHVESNAFIMSIYILCRYRRRVTTPSVNARNIILL